MGLWVAWLPLEAWMVWRIGHFVEFGQDVLELFHTRQGNTGQHSSR